MKTRVQKGKRKPTQPALPPGTEFALPDIVKLRLRHVATRIRNLQIAEGMILLLAGVSSMLIFRCLLDRWLDLPMVVRALFLLFDVGAIGWLLWQYPIRALLRRPSPATCALVYERQVPQLQSALISAVQLARAGSQAHGSKAYIESLLQQVGRAAKRLDARSALPAAHLRRLAIWALTGLIAATALALVFPSSSRLLIARYFVSQEQLPTRTRVFPISEALVQPVGSDATLAARASGEIPRSGRLLVEYADGQKREFPVLADPAEPEVFRFVMQNVQSNFTYRFILNDGHGSIYPVRTEVGPVIKNLICNYEFPAYTKLPPKMIPTGDLKLVAGGKLRLDIEASQSLKQATWQPDGQSASVAMEVAGSKAAATVPIDLTSLTGFKISLVNDSGVPSRNDAQYAIQVIPDEPPEVRILSQGEPPATITLAGGIDLMAKIRDDYGIAKVALCLEITKKPSQDRLVSAPELRRIPLKMPNQGDQVVFRWMPGREQPPLEPGDVVTYYIEAQDFNNITGPGIGESDRNTVTIVTADFKREEIAERLREKASEIHQVNESQRNASDELGEIIGGAKP